MKVRLLVVACLLLGFTSVSNAADGVCVGNSCARQVVSAPFKVLHAVVPNVCGKSSACGVVVEQPACGTVQSSCGTSKVACKKRFRLFR